ncbi:hypothetical protein HMPREF1503_0207 [Olsenella uli MSTE5]|nr:hypothetical protein HMPREF1503_0207 [Olsenella uli MSTE5]
MAELTVFRGHGPLPPEKVIRAIRGIGLSYYRDTHGHTTRHGLAATNVVNLLECAYGTSARARPVYFVP